MKAEDIGSLIIKQAEHFCGLYEVTTNAAWRSILDPTKGKSESDELETAMKACGWQAGWPYCAAFSEAIWRLAYTQAGAPKDVIAKFSKGLCPSVMQSYNALKSQITKDPIPGAIFFLQNGKGATGHAGIFVGHDGANMATIEGNTSAGKAISAEADRQGDGIFKKVRSFDFTPKTKGLHLLGFFNPIGW